MIISSPALIDGDHVAVVVAGDLVDGLPVGDEEALEAQLALEHIGEQVFVGRAS